MIRIYRASTEGFARARDCAPALVAATAHEALRRLAALGPTGPSEAEAARRALQGLEAAPAVDLVLAAGGALYRVYPEPAVSKTEAASTGSFATEVGARVLVAAPEPTASGLRDALRFLGYAASGVTPESKGPPSVLPLVRSLDPLVLIVAGSSLGALGEGAAAALRDRPRALVSLADPARDTDMVDAVVPTPLRIDRLASLLDPLVRRVTQERSRAEGAALITR